ncbi:MAG TPA: bifunctional hydroxymethylpyrimidine kinase/phosphomethylpyrimidine kinase [Gemmatimonadaceae bacterium]|jgi:hydroxymethylpyrimidine/phosphomethylpyrimidine kinase|nr:bifunctional hydroxymethylpyrimidine kinase/phosphomethylpyrimidine kinase [Gemmatimonadaceae bacterium]
MQHALHGLHGLHVVHPARTPNVLSIAGSDPSGGAGVQADLKTFAAFDVYGAAAITAITAQNTRAVAAVWPADPSVVAQQIDSVLSDISFDAIKIGMLATAEIVRAVATALGAYRPAAGRDATPYIVVDPVLRSSTGAALVNDRGVAALRDELLPLAFIITPNIEETGVLLGRTPPRSRAAMYAAAEDLLALGCQWALVTGGHVPAVHECVDVLAGADGHTREIRTTRVPGPDRHGTGCTLSSAIAALLALGHDVPDACEDAQAYVAAAITAAGTLGVGHGAGPLRHVAFSPATTAVHES